MLELATFLLCIPIVLRESTGWVEKEDRARENAGSLLDLGTTVVAPFCCSSCTWAIHLVCQFKTCHWPVLIWLIPHGHIRKVRESTKLMILRTRYCISELFSAEKSSALGDVLVISAPETQMASEKSQCKCFVAPIDCSLMVCLDLLRSFLLWCCSCLHNFLLSPLVAGGEDTKGYMRVRAVSHCGHCSLCVPWLRYARGHCGGMHGSHCMRPFRHFMIGYLPSITWSKGWSTLNCNRTNPLMRVLLDVIDLFLAKHCQLHHEIFYDLNL